MQRPDCIFCRIARGEIPARVVHASPTVLAFLDIHPIRPGHVLVVPRDHHAYFDDLPPDVAAETMHVAQRLAPALRRAVGVERVGLFFTGVDVAHAHAHVVPMVEPTDITSPAYIEQQGLRFRQAPAATAGELDATLAALQRELGPGG